MNRVASELTAYAVSGCASHRSTAVNAAPWRIRSGDHPVIQVDAEDLVVAVSEGQLELGAQLTVGAGDQDSHDQRFLTRSRSGAHQSRWSTYHLIVSSIACSKVRLGAQPRAALLSVAIE